jgi:hypothetical protein
MDDVALLSGERYLQKIRANEFNNNEGRNGFSTTVRWL